ncbi:MAG: phosphotransferase [Saprospiraceae bacterium]|nr:phosphotransferase [Saprospiraceae bacterium]
MEELLNDYVRASKDSTARLIHTHISWVLLEGEFAYKIKKPVQFSFLDFSTLEQRKHFCEEELQLNQRLAPSLYLAVVPLKKYGGKLKIDGRQGALLDYAIKMKRMPDHGRMDKLINNQQVNISRLEQLADRLAYFHQAAEPLFGQVDLGEMQKDVEDLESVQQIMQDLRGEAAAAYLPKGIAMSDQFLAAYGFRLQERRDEGFWVDGHGDLHCRNIFLEPEVQIFDCLEFDSRLRQTDVLSELAFLCMDLEAHGRKDLEAIFLEEYLTQYPCMLTSEDRLWFKYLKWYRAGIRVKVLALQISQGNGSGGRLEPYWNLYVEYLKKLIPYLITNGNKVPL